MFDCIFYHPAQEDVGILAGCNCTGYGFMEWTEEGPVWLFEL